jgi:hypothetical protein
MTTAEQRHCANRHVLVFSTVKVRIAPEKSAAFGDALQSIAKMFMKTLTSVLLVSIAAFLLSPIKAAGDGMFVTHKFAWDKHKDINEPTQKAILVYDAGR